MAFLSESCLNDIKSAGIDDSQIMEILHSGLKGNTSLLINTLGSGNQSNILVANELCLMQQEQYQGSYLDLPNGIWSFVGALSAPHPLAHLCQPPPQKKSSSVCLTSIIMNNGTFQLVRRSLPQVSYSPSVSLVSTGKGKLVLHAPPSAPQLVCPRTLEVIGKFPVQLPTHNSVQSFAPSVDSSTGIAYFVLLEDSKVYLYQWNTETGRTSKHALQKNGKPVRITHTSTFSIHITLSNIVLVASTQIVNDKRCPAIIYVINKTLLQQGNTSVSPFSCTVENAGYISKSQVLPRDLNGEISVFLLQSWQYFVKGTGSGNVPLSEPNESQNNNILKIEISPKGFTKTELPRVRGTVSAVSSVLNEVIWLSNGRTPFHGLQSPDANETVEIYSHGANTWNWRCCEKLSWLHGATHLFSQEKTKEFVALAITKIENGKVVEELNFVQRTSTQIAPAFVVRPTMGHSFSFGVSDFVGVWTE